ncbi:ribosome hibernation factor-recruiting GTPase MRF [Rhodococcoides corynebacterioides]|uniref:ribosome hibernation factor-recruiting GTPase MRF n=1 Tax=Rhodococcoides corynebacterioides TaxID=53972 RepID=UPI003AE30CB2
MTVDRTPLVLVCGPRGPLEAVTTSLAEPGTAVVHHDLSGVEAGVVTRRTTRVDADGDARVRDVALGVAGCCVDCMLRMDLLPLLRTLADDAAVRRIVVRLDPLLEAEALCWAIENTVVTGMVGRVDAPAGHDVRIEAVIGCVDAASFLGDATGDEPMSAYDDRTVAQVTVGNARHADVVVVADTAPDRWAAARLTAVLDRLAPRAATAWILPSETPTGLLARVPASARRGAVDDAHAPLLDGAPPLTEDCGVQLLEIADRRPFHPGRLHEAVDVLLDDVVHARGRLWVATQPDAVLWLESAGGGLRIAAAGRWLAAMDPTEYDDVSVARRAMAALGWDDEYGDRAQSLVVLLAGADPEHVHRVLTDALLTDVELADPESWTTWDDPFGQYHEDPCETDDSRTSTTESTLPRNTGKARE